MVFSSIENRIGYITLNSPENRNALGQEMVKQLRNTIAKLQEEKSLRAIVLRSDGPAFCSGADLAYLNKIKDFTYEENLADSQNLRQLFDLIHNSPILFISEVNGPAIAGGCGLATICDFCFASPESSFGYTEARIGFVPALVMVYLQNRVSGKDLREILLTGKVMTADEACQIGLINKVVPQNELRHYVSMFTENLIQTVSGSSVSRIKSMLRQLPSLNYDQALDMAAHNNAEARKSEDCMHGIQSFLNKEKIKW
jgi:methylglutaconyl-CoA hydratase